MLSCYKIKEKCKLETLTFNVCAEYCFKYLIA